MAQLAQVHFWQEHGAWKALHLWAQPTPQGGVPVVYSGSNAICVHFPFGSATLVSDWWGTGLSSTRPWFQPWCDGLSPHDLLTRLWSIDAHESVQSGLPFGLQSRPAWSPGLGLPKGGGMLCIAVVMPSVYTSLLDLLQYQVKPRE